jgi:hypothetical protein
MESMQENISEYKKQLDKGYIQKAYQGIMQYLMALRSHFEKKYPDYIVSGNIYYGYMDMTYFSCTPESLTRRKLKIAIVFIHEKIQFEVWLAGYNRQAQSKYWKLFAESNWNKYRIPSNIKGIDSIVEYTVAGSPDFDNLDTLMKQIEQGTMTFINDIEDFLSNH